MPCVLNYKPKNGKCRRIDLDKLSLEPFGQWGATIKRTLGVFKANINCFHIFVMSFEYVILNPICSYMIQPIFGNPEFRNTKGSSGIDDIITHWSSATSGNS